MILTMSEGLGNKPAAAKTGFSIYQFRLCLTDLPRPGSPCTNTGLFLFYRTLFAPIRT